MEAAFAIDRLEELLETMNIPANRTYVNLHNLKWLSKNLGSRNANHQNYEEASSLIELILKNKYYKN